MEIWLKSLSDRMDIGLCCRCRYESDEVLANLSDLQWIYVVIFAGNRSINYKMNRTSCVACRSWLSLFSSQSSSSSSPPSSSSSSSSSSSLLLLLLLLLFIHLSSRTERFWNYYFSFVFPWLHEFVAQMLPKAKVKVLQKGFHLNEHEFFNNLTQLYVTWVLSF